MNRRIMIATPTYDGKLDMYYVDSLHNTITTCLIEHDIIISPLFIAYDALLEKVRNELMQYAYESKVDDIVFIDTDIGWKVKDFIKLISYDVDCVGGTYRKKTDNSEEYVCKIIPENKLKREENNLIKVNGLGTGFLRLSKKLIEELYNSSIEYKLDTGKKYKRIFELSYDKDNNFISEDITLCNKIKSLGYDVYFDPSITCIHTGIKTYYGDFLNYEKQLLKDKAQ